MLFPCLVFIFPVRRPCSLLRNECSQEEDEGGLAVVCTDSPARARDLSQQLSLTLQV